MEVTHESGRVKVMPQDVESAPRPDMSSASWRLKSGRVKVVPQDVESPPRTESLRHDQSLRVNVAPQDVESPPRTDMSFESWRYESARVNFLPQMLHQHQGLTCRLRLLGGSVCRSSLK